MIDKSNRDLIALRDVMSWKKILHVEQKTIISFALGSC